MAAVLLYVCSAFVVWVCSAYFPLVQAGCGSLGNSVDCSKAGLLYIPTDLPKWVTRLELQSNGIKEIRPDDLKRLTQIEYLDLSKNSLTIINGSVFKDLVNLKVLMLDANQLTEIPRFPTAMKITTLSMVKNHIVTIPMDTIMQMPHLERLDLSSNNLLSVANGSFPSKCKLRYLNLNGNHISTIEQGSLNNLTSLEMLKLNRNRLADLPQAVFSQLGKLKTLELVRNDLRAITSLTFQGLKELQTLKLKRNRISILKDAAFYGLSSITSLYLDNNKINNITKAWLFGLPTLNHLSLDHNQVSSIEKDSWKKCTHLEKLDLDYNRMTAITDKSLAHLTHLRILFMDHNQLTRIDERAFQDLTKLNVLQLNDNELSWTMEDISGAFRGLNSLTKLGLRSNGIRSVGVPAFSGLQRLRVLDMEDNDFMSVQENAFETLRELRDLRFNSSKLNCDCGLAWLPTWLEKNRFEQSTLGTCFHPVPLRGVSMYQLDVKKLTCNDSLLPKPVIVESPKSANGFKGENLTLSCAIAIAGKGQPDIHWKKDRIFLHNANTEIIATSDGEVKRYTSNLRLVNIKHSMAGRYQCLVSNDFGSMFSQRAYVNVFVFPVFIKTPKDVTVKAGKPAELKCAATGQPTPVISWQKDGGTNFPAARERRMRVYPNDDHFYILNTRSDDEGVYSCMAESEAGQVVANATLTILETPDFVKPMKSEKRARKGETSVLQCMASGRPTPKLTWLKDNQELKVTPRHFFTGGNQLLVIVETQWSDGGIYSCRMSNSLGTAKGSTKLLVESASGDSAHSSGGSSGLDDESTTTGIIIIAVVCCVVGTSLVWVIIIYQTRKRHEIYSSTHTDETTLPGEIQSSGYVSSDKEGSYSQGMISTQGYYYQDYQMKESGYESSSGQYRSNGHPHLLAAFVDDDEDDPSPPVITAGDKLLQQMRIKERSSLGLHYPVSDGDTIGSRHSTSSGNHSASSNPPLSSHSGHSTIEPNQLHIFTNPLHSVVDFYPHRSPPSHASTPSPSFEEAVDVHSGINGSKSRLSPSPNPRPVLQTFHPKIPTNHDRPGRNDLQDGKGRHGCDGDVVSGRYPRPRHYSDSCDKRDVENSPTAVPSALPCPGCLAAQKARAQDVHMYSQIEARNNNNYNSVNNNNSNNNISSSSSHHKHGDSSKYSFSSLPPPSHTSSPHPHKLRTGSHSRVHHVPSSSPSSSHLTGEHSTPDPSPAGLSVCSNCNKSMQQQQKTGGADHRPSSPQQPLTSSNCTNSCLCSGSANELPPPNYDEVVSHNRHCHVPQTSATVSRSKALARSRSSSSIGRGDPMYYAYLDSCDTPPCGVVATEHHDTCCDANPSSLQVCSDCEHTVKRRASPQPKNERHAKQRSYNSPNHPPSAACPSASSPLITSTEPSSASSTIPSISHHNSG